MLGFPMSVDLRMCLILVTGFPAAAYAAYAAGRGFSGYPSFGLPYPTGNINLASLQHHLTAIANSSSAQSHRNNNNNNNINNPIINGINNINNANQHHHHNHSHTHHITNPLHHPLLSAASAAAALNAAAATAAAASCHSSHHHHIHHPLIEQLGLFAHHHPMHL